MNIIDRITNTAFRIKDRTNNLIRWAPVIWNDHDWDEYYLYVILHRKLKNMEEFFLSDRAMAEHAEKEAKKIRVCINLLNRLMKDEYDESIFEKHWKKWGRNRIDWKSGTIKIGNDLSEEEQEQESKEFMEACTKEEEMKKQDISYLFDYMKKHIRSWWD